MNFIAIKKLPTFWNTFQKSGLVFTKIKSFLINNIIFKLFSKTKKTNENKVKNICHCEAKKSKSVGKWKLHKTFQKHIANYYIEKIQIKKLHLPHWTESYLYSWLKSSTN